MITQGRSAVTGLVCCVSIGMPGAERRITALTARLQPAGEVLEMACGTGLWTRHLLSYARAVTAIDAATAYGHSPGAPRDEARVTTLPSGPRHKRSSGWGQHAHGGIVSERPIGGI